MISNSSTVDGQVAEGALGLISDLASLAGTGHDKLELSFDYTLGDPAEELYVHLWGYVDVSSTTANSVMNLGATNGNAWASADEGGTMIAYNLAGPDGAFAGTAGSASDAAVQLTGTTGAQSYSVTLDLSAFSTAPNRLEDYDYLVIGFARDIGDATTPSVTISNLVLNGGEAEYHSTSRRMCIFIVRHGSQ